MKIFPKNIAKIVAPTKNGPKGISDFKVFFLRANKITEIAAPIKKAKNKAAKIFGQPKIKPIKKANLASPMPIHLPLEIKIIARKNALARIADKKVSSIS
jgi:hypothetical protein